MRGYRKLILGLTYLVGSFGLAVVSVLEAQPLSGVATVVVAASAGVAAIVYGNAQEHKAEATAVAEVGVAKALNEREG